MISTYCTFWSLLPSASLLPVESDSQRWPIQIPIIQRDYAQGREDDKARGIRYKFLNSLLQVLENPADTALDLDFVYGDVRDGYFIPLDGQQRLTTLFLLHWYLAAVEGHADAAEERLVHFTYETRSSSRAFCQKLVSSRFEKKLKKRKSVSALIRDAAWFQPSWEQDPTVRGMLTMLEDMQQKFGLGGGLFLRLTNAGNPRVGFQFLQLRNAGLTDELYLKMNARGKPLTSFEVWKAEFDLFLQRTHSKELQVDFGLKADGDWTDLFWPYLDAQALIDTAFERYVAYITKMLDPLSASQSSSISVEKEDPFARYARIYQSEENVKFLFGTLDFLHATAKETDGIDLLFNSLFAANKYESGRVTFFGDNVNLLRRCLDNKEFNLKSQVVLFSTLYYAHYNNIKTGASLQASTEAQDLLRVVRNLLEAMQWRSETRLSSSLDPENIGRYLDYIKSLIAKTGHDTSVYELLDSEQAPAPVGFTMKAVKHEQVKAHFLCLHPERKEELFALESLPVFRGMLYNVNLEQHPYRLSDFRRAVEEIWSGQIEAGLIIRAWLTQGDYAPIFGWTNLGYKYFYGNDKEWATLLTHDGTDQVRQTLPTFLNSYLLAPGASPTDKLLYLIENWVTPNAQATDTWQYYFIKYEEMTSRLGEDFTGYYAWESENDKKTNFKIRLLNRTTLKGYHINPYVRTVALKLQDSQLAQVGKQFVKVIERSPLLLHESKVKLYSDEQGWQIKVSADYALPLEVAASFLLPLDVNGMQFLKSDSPDRIEVAVRFAEELHVAGLASLEKESEVSVA